MIQLNPGCQKHWGKPWKNNIQMPAEHSTQLNVRHPKWRCGFLCACSLKIWWDLVGFTLMSLEKIWLVVLGRISIGDLPKWRLPLCDELPWGKSNRPFIPPLGPLMTQTITVWQWIQYYSNHQCPPTICPWQLKFTTTSCGLDGGGGDGVLDGKVS